ncbi:hypothetical protein BGZ95_007819 [Linnemannia exigua]|uniref:Uncharacterized protein n=1 Tax=Linnemannia exigua TaxID=604196 RepID=A0AAD4DEU8_9FUNG|nr:hypothetical protein BGZ95_007819 [Linnemannia exigua]
MDHTPPYNNSSSEDTEDHTEEHRDKRQRTARHTAANEEADHLDIADQAQSDHCNHHDTVLSEVHIHPHNGLVDRRTIVSTFLLSRTGHALHSQQDSNDNDNTEEEEEEEEDDWDNAVEIKHAMGTDLRGVENCKANIDLNCASIETVKTRRLNWLMDNPLDLADDHHPDPFAWSFQERQDWRDNGAFILAADVVYDDSLTDALVDCLEKLITNPLPVCHPRHYIGRVAYMTMEKRYNFSLDELAVVAQAYEYFKTRIGKSEVLEAEEIDASSLSRHCDYDRTKDLVTNAS